MKRYIYSKWILPAAAAIIMASCVDTGINKDPNTSGDMDPNLQITTIQLLPNTARNDIHRYFIYPGGFMNQWTNDWAITTYGGNAKKSDVYFSMLWDVSYAGTIKNVVDLVERTKGDDSRTNAHAAGKVLKVENFLKLTDYYGDIPYSEAGQAFFQGIFLPKYDKQEDIYKDFLVQLKEAAGMFNASADPLTADLYFGGDISKWKKYANSLRFRIAMRLIKVDATLAKTEAEDAAKAGLMTSNADICFVKHTDVVELEGSSAGNGISNLFFDGKESTFRITREMVKLLEDSKDPRLLMYASSYLADGSNITRTDITQELYDVYGSYAKFAIPAQMFNYETAATAGLTNNIEITTSKGEKVKVSFLYQFLQPSRLFCKADAPNIRMSYAEVEFLQADAILRGFNIPGTAAQHYKAGLEAAVNQMSLFGATVDATELANFLDLPANALSSNKTEGLKQVNTQIWVLHIVDPFETWANVRRSGEPEAFTQFFNHRPAENETKGVRPTRIPYPTTEQTANRANYEEAVARIEGGVIEGGSKDNWLNRVWWDKN